MSADRKPGAFRFPTDEELRQLAPHAERQAEVLYGFVREAEAAFASGADFVSLRADGQEIGRVYRDGRPWTPPGDNRL